MLRSVKTTLLAFWNRYEHHIRAVMLITGFVTDLFIAKRPDAPFVNFLLLSYLLISAACIVLLARRAMRVVEIKAEPIILLLVLQFCFGGLASNLLILYGKSGMLAGNLLFIGMLAAMLIGNEFLKSRYNQLRFNIAVYYVLLLTYCIIAVPTFVLHTIGAGAFMVSGVLSLGITALFIFILSRSARVFQGEAGRTRLIQTSTIIGMLFIFWSALYFGNIIPPVPLSMKDAGMYHSLVHEANDSYTGTYEAVPWWQFWKATSGTFHTKLGERAYCFSSIFAPTGLSTGILHRWEYLNPETNGWETVSDVSFPISGGRGEGYRGFSIKSITQAGNWRCDVETAQGQLIGRLEFTADVLPTTVGLSSRSL